MFVASSVPTRPPKSIKIHEPSMPKRNPSWTSNVYEIFNEFSLILRSSESLESKGVLKLPRLSVQNEKITTKTSQKPSFSFPKSSPNRVQDGFKTASESTTIFCSILMRFGKPKWCHVGAMLTPKIPQNLTKIDVRNEVAKMMEKCAKKSRGAGTPETNQQGYKLY